MQLVLTSTGSGTAYCILCNGAGQVCISNGGLGTAAVVYWITCPECHGVGRK